MPTIYKSWGFEKHFFDNNLCEIEIMTNFRKWYEDRKDKAIEGVVQKLQTDKIISKIEDILLFGGIEVEFERGQGHALNGLKQIMKLAKQKGYKYMLALAVTYEGREFCKHWENLGNDYYGLKITEPIEDKTHSKT